MCWVMQGDGVENAETSLERHNGRLIAGSIGGYGTGRIIAMELIQC